MTEDQAVQVRALASQGATQMEIAAQVGVSQGAVSRLLLKGTIGRKAPPNKFVWSPELDAKLRHEYMVDRLSQTEIASRLHTSLKTLRTRIVKLGLVRPAVVRPRRAQFAVRPKPPPEVPAPPSRSLQLWQLEPRDCRWPEGDQHPFLFCGAPRYQEHVYCQHHCRVAYRWQTAPSY